MVVGAESADAVSETDFNKSEAAARRIVSYCGHAGDCGDWAGGEASDSGFSSSAARKGFARVLGSGKRFGLHRSRGIAGLDGGAPKRASGCASGGAVRREGNWA